MTREAYANRMRSAALSQCALRLRAVDVHSHRSSFLRDENACQHPHRVDVFSNPRKQKSVRSMSGSFLAHAQSPSSLFRDISQETVLRTGVRNVSNVFHHHPSPLTSRKVHTQPPNDKGFAIEMTPQGELRVPDNPIIPYIEGDGTGPDIWNASVRVFDAAVAKAYGGRRQIQWLEVLAGEKAFRKTGQWLPQETIDAYLKYYVGIKGPLSTPSGRGLRSINVTIRKKLDLYVAMRPVRWFAGVPSPVKKPSSVDMVIFRENIEDVHAGIEFEQGSEEAARLMKLLKEEFPEKYKKLRFPDTTGFSLKTMSREGTERIMRAALMFALENQRSSLTIVHKGNIMKSTEGAFKQWCYAVATEEFREHVVTERESWILYNYEMGVKEAESIAKLIEPGFEIMTTMQQNLVLDEVSSCLKDLGETHGQGKWSQMLLVKDAITDSTLQQVMTRADEFDILVTMNLNGQYLSDALAAQVGGTGISPGANINYVTGHAMFEATHGTAPKYANLDRVNPGSLILSGEMMLRFMGWSDAADLIMKGMNSAIADKQMTYDFERLTEGATLLKCSEFADAVIKRI